MWNVGRKWVNLIVHEFFFHTADISKVSHVVLEKKLNKCQSIQNNLEQQ